MEDKFARMKMPCAEIGRALACSSDEEQAAVLNALGAEVHIVCRGNAEMQLCYMARELDRHGRKLVLDLAEFIALREKAEKEKE